MNIDADALRSIEVTLTRIEPITDPIGKKYWQQPDVDGIAIDDEVAMMSSNSFGELLDYTFSVPTGLYVGKCWKAMHGGHWYLRWVASDPTHSAMLLLHARRIEIID